MLLELSETPAYQRYLLPFLLNLAQDGYPKPKDYQSNEKLILDYTQKVGETEAVKKITDFISAQKGVIEAIKKKYDGKKDFAI